MKTYRKLLAAALVLFALGVGGAIYAANQSQSTVPTCHTSNGPVVMKPGDLCIGDGAGTATYQEQLDHENSAIQRYGWAWVPWMFSGFLLLLVPGAFKNRDNVTVSESTLLTADEVRTAVGESGSPTVKRYRDLFDSAAGLEHPEWAGALLGTQVRAYGKPGKKTVIDGVQRMDAEFTDDAGHTRLRTSHSAVGFPSIAHATKAFTRQRKIWPQVAGNRVVIEGTELAVGTLTDLGDTLVMPHTADARGGWAWVRMMSLHRNVIVEVEVSARGAETGRAADLLDAAVAKAMGESGPRTRDRLAAATS